MAAPKSRRKGVCAAVWLLLAASKRLHRRPFCVTSGRITSHNMAQHNTTSLTGMCTRGGENFHREMGRTAQLQGRSVLSVVPLFCSAGCDADGILWGGCDDSSVFLRPKVMQNGRLCSRLAAPKSCRIGDCAAVWLLLAAAKRLHSRRFCMTSGRIT